MKVNLTKGKDWKRTLEIEVPFAEVESQMQEALAKLQKKARIPGFRPGKAPLDLVKSQFQGAAQEEAIENLLNSSYRKALEETKLYPVGSPKIFDLKFAPGSPLSFKAEFETQPEVEAKDYKKLKLVKKIAPVEDVEVNQAVDYLRERNAELRPVEREAKVGDFVAVDLEEKYMENGKPANKKYENQLLELDPKLLLKEFTAALPGIKPGEERELQVEYAADNANARLAGKKVTYKVKAREIKEKVLPALDENFAKSQGDFHTLLEMRLKVRESLEKKHAEEAQKDLEEEVRRLIVEKNSFAMPETLLSTYLDHITAELKKRYPQLDEAKIREENRKPASDRLRWEYLFHKLAQAEKISINDDDIQKRIASFAAAYNLPPEKALEYLQQGGQIDRMKEDILEEKVLEWIISQSEVKEERMERK